MKRMNAWILALALLLASCLCFASCEDKKDDSRDERESTRAEEDGDQNGNDGNDHDGNDENDDNSGTQSATSLWSGEIDRSWYSVLDTEFTLTTAEQLAVFAQIVNEGADFLNVTVKLGADIDLNNLPWTPIGTATTAFAGTFDGAGHTISNCNLQPYIIEYDDGFSYDGDEFDLYEGFFAKITGCIKNLTLDHVIIDIENETQEFDSVYVGGLIGYANEGTIKGCTLSGNIQCAVKAGSLTIGGLVGYSYFSGISIMDCASNGDITFAYTYADTQSYSECIVGGLVGTLNSNIERSSSTVNIQGSADRYLSVGGLLGEASGGFYIRNCYAMGDISIQAFSASIGGLSNGSVRSIENCYTTGNLSITSPIENIGDCKIGGLCAQNWDVPKIKNCWVLGNITMNGKPASQYNTNVLGSLVSDSFSDDIINCYRHSGQTINAVTEAEVYTQGTPASESDLKSVRLYTERLGWDSTVWNFEDGKYPTLKSPAVSE